MKKRVDVLLVENGLAISRQKAQAMIMSGDVFFENRPVTKPSELFEDTALFTIKQGIPYVSRGGLKLEKAINVFNIDLYEKVCIDIGASTGGFTDCMLQNGAKKVYAVDVGYGQLDWTLRNNSKVVVQEKTNARYLKSEMYEENIDFISVDVSFISLSLLFQTIDLILGANGHCMTLIKPQFEAGKGKVGKNGVVRNRQTHFDVIKYVIAVAAQNHFEVLGLDFSPITGPKGNIEFIAYWKHEGEFDPKCNLDGLIQNTISNAYSYHNVNYD